MRPVRCTSKKINIRDQIAVHLLEQKPVPLESACPRQHNSSLNLRIESLLHIRVSFLVTLGVLVLPFLFTVLFRDVSIR